MALSKLPYTGTRDFFPKDKRVRDYIFNMMSETAEQFGYEPYDGPLLEEVDLYKAKSGEELINDQIYSFTDRGERFVAIRPEMTPTLARMVAQISRTETRPIRWYAIPNLMRYERPQKGRLREHWQFNCDIFGADESKGTLEILMVAIKLMRGFGANETQFEIDINDRRVVDSIFKNLMKLENEKIYKLYKIIDKSKKVSSEALDEMIKKLEIGHENELVFKNYLSLSNFDDLFSFLNKYNLRSVCSEFETFYKNITEMDLAKYMRFDPCVVRGLDYYTGIVFEIFDKHPDNRRAICGGGAYANLLQIFNEDPLPGVGFGLGDVTLTDFLKTHNLLPDLTKPRVDLFLSYQIESAETKALSLANALRNSGLKVVMGLSPISYKKLFPIAEKRGSSFVAMIDEQELSKNVVQIKNMKDRSQFEIEIENIEKIVNVIRGHSNG